VASLGNHARSALVQPLLYGQGMKRLVAALVLATAGTAAAQPAETPAKKVPTASEWYGWQILGADAAVLGTATLTDNGTIALGWIGSGAVVHVAHGHEGRAIGSIAARVALPFAGLMLGAASSQGCSGDLCGFGPAIVGGLIGMGTAEVIDLVDATDEREIVPVSAPRWQPVAKVSHSTATVGFVARF
jgi:hypothetical protein